MAPLAQASKVSLPSAVQRIRKSPRATKPIDTWQWLIIFLLAANIQSDLNGRSMMPICRAGPVPTSLVLPPTSSADSPSIQVVNLTRQHGGDIFTAFGKSSPFILLYNHFHYVRHFFFPDWNLLKMCNIIIFNELFKPFFICYINRLRMIFLEGAHTSKYVNVVKVLLLFCFIFAIFSLGIKSVCVDVIIIASGWIVLHTLKQLMWNEFSRVSSRSKTVFMRARKTVRERLHNESSLLNETAFEWMCIK